MEQKLHFRDKVATARGNKHGIAIACCGQIIDWQLERGSDDDKFGDRVGEVTCTVCLQLMQYMGIA